MKADIQDRMNQLKGMLPDSFRRNVFGDDEAAAKAAEKLDADIEAADEGLAAGFANNSKKKKQDNNAGPVVNDEFKPDTDYKKHCGSGVYDCGTHIHVTGKMTQKKAAIVAGLVHRKGWDRVAVYNHDRVTMNKEATGVLMQSGVPCIHNPKEFIPMREIIPVVRDVMAARQQQIYEYNKMMVQPTESAPKPSQ